MTPVVTGLRERKRGRVAVELDGRLWRVLPTDGVVRAGLAVGRPLDRPTARELAREVRRATLGARSGRASQAIRGGRKKCPETEKRGRGKKPRNIAPGRRKRTSLLVQFKEILSNPEQSACYPRCGFYNEICECWMTR